MKLISLSIENFRQFYGKQNKIEFSNSKDKNVTVLFGANGAGKSTILNAFTWVLYNETSASFENPTNIINDKVKYEANLNDTIEAIIKLEFDHNGKTYIAKRIRKERKIEHPDKTDLLEEGELKLDVVLTDGTTQESSNPSDLIEQVLPKRLHNFFFFDGERIEALAKKSAYEEIEHAIKSILGLKILERSINHLNGQVKRSLDKELKSVGTKEVQDIIDNIQFLEDQKKKKNKEYNSCIEHVSLVDKNLEKIKDKLRTLEETKELQNELDEKEIEIDNIEQQIRSINNSLKEKISRNGYSSFIPPLITKVHEILKDKRQKKEIPSGIKKKFVEDLLSSKECICGAKLFDNGKPNDHYRKVEGWLEKSGSNDIEEHAIKIESYLKDLSDRRTNLYEKIKEMLSKKEIFEEKLNTIGERVSELNHLLDDKDSEEIQELNKKKHELEEKKNSYIERKGFIKKELESIEESLNDLEAKKDAADTANENANLIKKRLSVRGEVVKFLEITYSLLSEEVRNKLDNRVRRIHNDISFKNFYPEITKDFQLVLKKNLGSEVESIVAKSTGENQITSLSFIAAIADYARSLTKGNNLNSILGFEGGIYPLVMDSPFGTLDTNYKQSVAQAIPRLAEQVVILVSKSQGEGVVLDEIKSKIEKCYILTFHTNKEDKSLEEDIHYKGRNYPYIRLHKDGSFEKAAITSTN